GAGHGIALVFQRLAEIVDQCRVVIDEQNARRQRHSSSTAFSTWPVSIGLVYQRTPRAFASASACSLITRTGRFGNLSMRRCKAAPSGAPGIRKSTRAAN